jgi:hypothetical protein
MDDLTEEGIREILLSQVAIEIRKKREEHD